MNQDTNQTNLTNMIGVIRDILVCRRIRKNGSIILNDDWRTK
jgi:hypothetical protein